MLTYILRINCFDIHVILPVPLAVIRLSPVYSHEHFGPRFRAIARSRDGQSPAHRTRSCQRASLLCMGHASSPFPSAGAQPCRYGCDRCSVLFASMRPFPARRPEARSGRGGNATHLVRTPECKRQQFPWHAGWHRAFLCSSRTSARRASARRSCSVAEPCLQLAVVQRAMKVTLTP